MVDIKDTVIELEHLLDNLLRDDYFGCIYGSYAIGTNNQSSDVDLFIASSHTDKTAFKKIKNFVVSFHQKNNLCLDEEVPYENKLYVSYRDVADALDLKGFEKMNNKIIVPKIEKTKIFLASRPVRLRLIFNALTTPHIFFGKNKSGYQKYIKDAEASLRYLSRNLLKSASSTFEDQLAVLLNGPEGTDGEMYLGYKKNPKVINYITQILREDNESRTNY